LFWTGARAVRVGNGHSALYGESIDPNGSARAGGAYARVSWRDQYAAVSTGREVLVWGGASDLGQLSDGAVFSPEQGAWRAMSRAPLTGRSAPASVWTGSEMVIVGGATDRAEFFRDGAAYDPGADDWSPIAPFPGEPRFAACAVWTNREVLVWGGVVRGGFATDGAAYDPHTDRWRPIAPSPLNGRVECTAVWTSRHMLVWGGTQRNEIGDQLADGAAYDPAADTWTVLPRSPLHGRYGHTAVWTGSSMIVWGGADTAGGDAPPHVLGDGASLDPATGAWSPLPPSPLGPRYHHAATWTGRDMIVGGGCCRSSGETAGFTDAASYRPD
jgi:N-acetylneuraminic acid mutarotase